MTTIPACTSVAMTLVSVGLSLASSGYVSNVSARLTKTTGSKCFASYDKLKSGRLQCLDSSPHVSTPDMDISFVESASNSDKQAHIRGGSILIKIDGVTYAYDRFDVKADGNCLYASVVNAVKAAQGLDEFKYENVYEAIKLRNDVGLIFADYKNEEFDSQLLKVRKVIPGADDLFKEMDDTREDLVTAKQKYIAQHMENSATPSSVSKMLIGTEFEAAAISATPLFADGEGELRVYDHKSETLHRYWKGEEIFDRQTDAKWVAQIFLEENQYGSCMIQPGTDTTPLPASAQAQQPDLSDSAEHGSDDGDAPDDDDDDGTVDSPVDIMIKIRDYVEAERAKGTAFPITEIPKFVVFGAQSSGKSRLIEALARKKFNFVSNCGMATTRPTHIRFQPCPRSKHDRSVIYLGTTLPGSKIVDYGEPLSDSELMRKMTELQTETNLTVDPTGSNKIHLKIEGPDVYDIEIVDLPGYQTLSGNVAVEEGDQGDVDDANRQATNILKLARSYLNDESNHIIVVDEAKEGRAREVFWEIIANQGLLTKGDWNSRVTADVELRRQELNAFLGKRVMFVQTKMDLFERIEGFRPKSLKRWIVGEGSEKFVEEGKKFAFRLPDFNSGSAGHDEEVCESEAFKSKLNDCNAEDQTLAHVLEEKLSGSADEKERELAHKYPGAMGFHNFERELSSEFFELFKQQIKPTITQMEKQVGVTKQTILDLQKKLTKAKTKQYDNAPAHFSWAIADIARGTNIVLPVNCRNRHSCFTGETVKVDNDNFIKHTLFKDDSHNYYQLDHLDHQKGIEGQIHGENELDALVVEGFVKHAEEIDGVFQFSDVSAYGGIKLRTMVSELRLYISSQDVSYDQETFEKYLEANAYNPYKLMVEKPGNNNEYVNHRMSITESFLHNRVMPELKLHMAAVGHRIVKTYQDMFEPAIVHLQSQRTKPFPQVQEAALYSDTGDSMDESQVLKETLKARYDKYLNKLFDDFRKQYQDDMTAMFYDWKRLPETSYVDVLKPGFNAFASKATLDSEDLQAWEDKLTIRKGLENYFTNEPEWTVPAVPNPTEPNRESVEQSRKRSAERLYKIVRNVSLHIRSQLAENLVNLVDEYFFSKIQNGAAGVGTAKLTGALKGKIMDEDLTLTANLHQQINEARSRKKTLENLLRDLKKSSVYRLD